MLPELERPVLADKVVPEAVMWLLVRQHESNSLVDAAGGDEDVVGPQHHRGVPGFAGEGDALVDQPRADTQSSGPRLDEQDSQLRRRRISLNAEHPAGACTANRGDPGVVSAGSGVGTIVGDDLSNETLEIGVPVELVRIDRTMAADDPSEIARLEAADADGGAVVGSRAATSLGRERSSPLLDSMRN